MLKQKLKNVEIDSVLLNLSMYCPTYCLTFEKTKNCQLSEARKFSILQKVEWLKKITDNQKLAMYQKHEECFSKNR